jgi:hypothetical protein
VFGDADTDADASEQVRYVPGGADRPQAAVDGRRQPRHRAHEGERQTWTRLRSTDKHSLARFAQLTETPRPARPPAQVSLGERPNWQLRAAQERQPELVKLVKQCWQQEPTDRPRCVVAVAPLARFQPRLLCRCGWDRPMQRWCLCARVR